MGCILVRQMAPMTLVESTKDDGHHVEGNNIICNIVVAVHTWRSYWCRQKILFHCDNQAVVSIWKSGTTRASETMGLVRLLYFCATKYNINVCITYIPGINNDITDCPSCYQQDKFRMLAPEASYAQDIIPTNSFTEASCNTSLMELLHPPLIEVTLPSHSSSVCIAKHTLS